MAPTSSQLYGQMQGVMDQYKAMTPATSSQITDELLRRVDYFRPQLQEISGAEASAYASPAALMEQFNQRFGMGDERQYGPSASAQLSSILSNVGQQMGTVDTLNNILASQRGRIEQMGGDIYNQYNASRQALMDRYNMLTPLYQSALQREEAARARAARARAAQAQAAAYQRAQAANARAAGGNLRIRTRQDESLGGKVSGALKGAAPLYTSLRGGGLPAGIVRSVNKASGGNFLQPAVSKVQSTPVYQNVSAAFGGSDVGRDLKKRTADVANAFLGGNYFSGYQN